MDQHLRKNRTSFARSLIRREIHEGASLGKYRVTDEFIERLGLAGELDGHTGCVNCLEWNEDGRILASGSDDCHICLWDGFKKKLLTNYHTGHHGNIFSVKFLPSSSSTLLTASADHSVRSHDLSTSELLTICTCHSGRVKRLATSVLSPHSFWSGAEDGRVLEGDKREKHECSEEGGKSKRTLVDLRRWKGGRAEVKCIAINPRRPEIIGVGANDAIVRLYDRRMIKIGSFEESQDGSDIPVGAIQYFVPGHIPLKEGEYSRKYRSLTSTYIEFNPDGTELLANLGGEQIYVFPLVPDYQKNISTFTVPYTTSSVNCPEVSICDGGVRGENGYVKETVERKTVILPPYVETIKRHANEAFEARKYSRAIQLYNEALSYFPNSGILLGNRSAAYIKRNWDGDIYSALKDCYAALALEPAHDKAFLRICRCLLELSLLDAASSTFFTYKSRFPASLTRSAVLTFEKDLTEAQAKKLAPSSPSSISSLSSSSELSFFPSSPSSTTSSENSGGINRPPSPNIFLRFGGEESLESDSSTEGDTIVIREKSKKSAPLSASEDLLLKSAIDFSERYCGHCNITTDIKEANFFGDYIVGGSDDGSFLIWSRRTTNIVRILKGDESIVNCIQPHKDTCLLATSGIEQVIRLWAPLPHGTVNERAVGEWNDVASENQRRMRANPFEMIFMNMMSPALNGDDSTDDTDPNSTSNSDSSQPRRSIDCNTT